MTQIPAGWYPDPSPQQQGQTQLLRYWDGRLWTNHVQSAYPMAATPYAGPGPAAGPTTPDGVPLASWWRRVGANTIDSLLVGVVCSVVTIPLQLRLTEEMNDLTRRFEAEASRSETTLDFGTFFGDIIDVMLPFLTWSLIATFVIWAVYSSMMLRFKGATVGKLALGIAVRLRERPGQLPWSNILRRVLVQQGVLLTVVVPVLYLALFWFFYLDSLWPLWDKKKQALHDKAARTNVVVVR